MVYVCVYVSVSVRAYVCTRVFVWLPVRGFEGHSAHLAFIRLKVLLVNLSIWLSDLTWPLYQSIFTKPSRQFALSHLYVLFFHLEYSQFWWQHKIHIGTKKWQTYIFTNMTLSSKEFMAVVLWCFIGCYPCLVIRSDVSSNYSRRRTYS